jgi:hypothetical protein
LCKALLLIQFLSFKERLHLVQGVRSDFYLGLLDICYL